MSTHFGTKQTVENVVFRQRTAHCSPHTSALPQHILCVNRCVPPRGSYKSRSVRQFILPIDCSALHRASNFNFFRVRFCVDGRGAAAGLGLVEDRHDF